MEKLERSCRPGVAFRLAEPDIDWSASGRCAQDQRHSARKWPLVRDLCRGWVAQTHVDGLIDYGKRYEVAVKLQSHPVAYERTLLRAVVIRLGHDEASGLRGTQRLDRRNTADGTCVQEPVAAAVNVDTQIRGLPRGPRAPPVLHGIVDLPHQFRCVDSGA